MQPDVLRPLSHARPSPRNPRLIPIIIIIIISFLFLLHGSLLIYRPLRDGWLSWPCWLTDSGRLNHKVVSHPASSLAQDRESSPAKTSVLTTVLRRQHYLLLQNMKKKKRTSNRCIRRHCQRIMRSAASTRRISPFTFSVVDFGRLTFALRLIIGSAGVGLAWAAADRGSIVTAIRQQQQGVVDALSRRAALVHVIGLTVRRQRIRLGRAASESSGVILVIIVVRLLTLTTVAVHCHHQQLRLVFRRQNVASCSHRSTSTALASAHTSDISDTVMR